MTDSGIRVSLIQDLEEPDPSIWLPGFQMAIYLPSKITRVHMEGFSREVQEVTWILTQMIGYWQSLLDSTAKYPGIWECSGKTKISFRKEESKQNNNCRSGAWVEKNESKCSIFLYLVFDFSLPWRVLFQGGMKRGQHCGPGEGAEPAVERTLGGWISVSTNKHAMTISLMSGIPLNWVKSHYFAIRCKFEN